MDRRAYRFGRRQRFYEEYTADSWSGRRRHSTNLWFCLIGLLSVAFMVILLTVLFYKYSPQDYANTETVATLGLLQVPESSMPIKGFLTTRTMQQRTPVPATPAVVDIAPHGRHHGSACTSRVCHFVAQVLRARLDFSVNPCQDFYSYVCGLFSGSDQISQSSRLIRVWTTSYAKNVKVPPTKQTSWQKAAGLFQACVAFAHSKRNETGDLVTWMTSVNLDLANETTLAKVGILDMIVRCSLDFGIHAIFSITFDDAKFVHNKRLMRMKFSEEQEDWLKGRQNISETVNSAKYAQRLQYFGVDPSSQAPTLASRIIEYEKQLYAVFEWAKKGESAPDVQEISNVWEYTGGYINRSEWAKVFPRYTNKTYKGTDHIVYQQYVITILVNILKGPVGFKRVRYLIAWSVFRQLVEYTLPSSQVDEKKVDYTCYRHVLRVMKLALVSPFLQTMVRPESMQEVDGMVKRIRQTFRMAFESSGWTVGRMREIVLRKLSTLKHLVGSPGKFHDPAFIDKYYEGFPDVPTDMFFVPWRKALSMSAHQKWMDQTTHFYDWDLVNAYFNPAENTVVIPTGILQRPYYFGGAPAALNYGGIGTIISHEIMHSYDVHGLTFDEQGRFDFWGLSDTNFLEPYAKRVICMRKSHESLTKKIARTAPLYINAITDSERIADFVGTPAAYRTFASLPLSDRQMTLYGLNITAERLFFILYCVKWCAFHTKFISEAYAPFNQRCMVPLMHMPEFSDAFGCPVGSPMNPPKKCPFWFSKNDTTP